MNTLTKEQAIEWLENQNPKQRYSYFNKEYGCLFSQIYRHYFPECPHAIVLTTEEIVKNDSFYVAEIVAVGIIPFHNDFWNRLDRLQVVTPKRAIKVLRSLP